MINMDVIVVDQELFADLAAGLAQIE